MKKRRWNFIMRYTSMVLASILLCLSTLQVHAMNAYASQHVQQQQIQQTRLTDEPIADQFQTSDDANQNPLKRNKRAVGAVVWAGWGIAELLAWMGVRASISYLAAEGFIFLTKELADAMAESDARNKPIYFKAKIPQHNSRESLLISGGLTEEEAITHAKASFDVWTKNESDARRLAALSTGSNRYHPQGFAAAMQTLKPENHAQNGCKNNFYYHHYHDGDRHNGHIFYGTHRREGYKYCYHPSWYSHH